jgi:hypothetical protein
MQLAAFCAKCIHLLGVGVTPFVGLRAQWHHRKGLVVRSWDCDVGQSNNVFPRWVILVVFGAIGRSEDNVEAQFASSGQSFIHDHRKLADT